MNSTKQIVCGWLRDIIKYRCRTKEPRHPCPTADTEVKLTIPVAGIFHSKRAEYVKRLSLRSKVLLCREPSNPVDSNAVLVTNTRNQQIGYLPKEVAAILNKPIQNGQIDKTAEVISLQTSPCQSNTMMRIALKMPKSVAERLQVTPILDYTFERNHQGRLVMLIDCDGSLLDDIRASLESMGYHVDRIQESCRQSQSGYLYRWYVLFNENVSQEAIRACIIGKTQIYPHGEEVDEYAKEFDLEKRYLQQSLVEAQNELSIVGVHHKDELTAYQKKIKEERSLLLQEILPENISLVHDSWDVLVNCPEQHYLTICKIALNHADLQVKSRVREAPEWFELKHATGGDRVYFKPKGDKTEIVLSQKTRQEHDFKWMRKH